MPRGSPFTQLCRLTAELTRPVAADLHTHTHLSDGDSTPSQLVAFAKQAKLSILAVTDHDTTAAFAPACETAASFPGRKLTVVPGVEISTHIDGREYHLLAYRFDVHHAGLQAMLAAIRQRRKERFAAYRAALPPIPDDVAKIAVGPAESWGRRHLAQALVLAGHAADRGDAFRRLMNALNLPPTHAVPITEAIRTVTDAGGVTSLAHPPADTSKELLLGLQQLGLGGVEATHPALPVAFRQQLRTWANELGLVTTGGSDFHGPGHRTVGSVGIGDADFARLAAFAARPD